MATKPSKKTTAAKTVATKAPTARRPAAKKTPAAKAAPAAKKVAAAKKAPVAKKIPADKARAENIARKSLRRPAGPGVEELKFGIESAFERRATLTLHELDGSTRPLVSSASPSRTATVAGRSTNG